MRFFKTVVGLVRQPADKQSAATEIGDDPLARGRVLQRHIHCAIPHAGEATLRIRHVALLLQHALDPLRRSINHTGHEMRRLARLGRARWHAVMIKIRILLPRRLQRANAARGQQ